MTIAICCLFIAQQLKGNETRRARAPTISYQFVFIVRFDFTFAFSCIPVFIAGEMFRRRRRRQKRRVRCGWMGTWFLLSIEIYAICQMHANQSNGLFTKRTEAASTTERECEEKIIWGSINEDIANIVVLSMYKMHLIHSKLQR